MSGAFGVTNLNTSLSFTPFPFVNLFLMLLMYVRYIISAPVWFIPFYIIPSLTVPPLTGGGKYRESYDPNFSFDAWRCDVTWKLSHLYNIFLTLENGSGVGSKINQSPSLEDSVSTMQAYKRAMVQVVPPVDVVTDTYSLVVRAICHCGCDRSL